MLISVSDFRSQNMVGSPCPPFVVKKAPARFSIYSPVFLEWAECIHSDDVEMVVVAK